jgi:hypothetical protein
MSPKRPTPATTTPSQPPCPGCGAVDYQPFVLQAPMCRHCGMRMPPLTQTTTLTAKD